MRQAPPPDREDWVVSVIAVAILTFVGGALGVVLSILLALGGLGSHLGACAGGGAVLGAAGGLWLTFKGWT